MKDVPKVIPYYGGYPAETLEIAFGDHLGVPTALGLGDGLGGGQGREGEDEDRRAGDLHVDSLMRRDSRARFV